MTAVPPHSRGYQDFGGRVGRTVADSESWWPAPVRPRDGAPNVIVVLLDDMGYSDIGPFGAEIDTPVLDRLAARGTRLTNYHTTPVCSPARAALLTGLNPHRAGFASVANFDPGFPNLTLELADDVLTLREILRANGYATFAVGKWHLTRDALMNDGAPKGTWPLQRGLDRYYGTLEGCNSFFHPNRLIADNSPVDVDDLGDDYYLTDDLTDHAIDMVKGLRANDDRPFFLYVAHHAMHGPLGAKPADISKYRGRFDHGWDAVRESRFAANSPRACSRPALCCPDRTRTGRSPYRPGSRCRPAGAGCSPATWRCTRRWSTTSIRTSAASSPPSKRSASSKTRSSCSRPTTAAPPRAAPTAPVATSVSSCSCPTYRPTGNATSPGTWTSSGAADDGALSPRLGPGVEHPVPVLQGPDVRRRRPRTIPAVLAAGLDERGIRPQYQYVTDVTPTLLELTGVTVPEQRHGRPTQQRDGRSFSSVLHSPGAPSSHPEQYAESTAATAASTATAGKS